MISFDGGAGDRLGGGFSFLDRLQLIALGDFNAVFPDGKPVGQRLVAIVAGDQGLAIFFVPVPALHLG